MTINNLGNIRDIFTSFHDGSIVHFCCEEDSLLLEVEIQFLAKRVDARFQKFFVRLAGLENVYFKTWPRGPKAESAVLVDMAAIFKPELEILDANLKENEIQVVCNQYSPEFNYRGGELYFCAASAEVTDEAGKVYSIDELAVLWGGYLGELATGRR